MEDWNLPDFSDLLATPMPWPVAAAAVVLFIVAGEIGYRVGFRLLQRLTVATATTLDDVLLKRMRLPAQLLIAVGAVHVLLAARGVAHGVGQSAVVIVELLLVTRVAVETFDIVVLQHVLGERRQIHMPAVVRHLILVVLYAVAVLSILGSVTGVDLAPILATSTVLTVVLGLAVQDTLGNLFAGLALHVEKPFAIEDWILVEGVEGQVVYMGWRSTRMRTFSGDVVSLPNATIAKARVHNFSAPALATARNVEFPVAADAAPETVERAVLAACARVPAVADEPAPKVWLLAQTPLFQRYVVKVWLPDFARHDDAESDLQKALWHACREAGIQAAQAGVGVDPHTGEATATWGAARANAARSPSPQVEPGAVAQPGRVA